MTSAALQDLRDRIASNTLTGPQQAALTTALDEIIPTFPTPDELSGGIPANEQVLARDWIAALYAIDAEGTAMLPTNVTAWWVNNNTGSDTNSGTSAQSPLKTNAALAALWRGTAGGGRPVLSPATGTTITVHIGADWPDDDPLAPLLDVDITNGNALIITGAGAETVAYTGTIATANAWARTVANGQVKITDAGVANYGAFIGGSMFLHDTNTGAVAWLYGPDSGSSATGTCTVGYSAQTAGTLPTITETAINAGNGYTLSNFVKGPIGQGFVSRSFPLEGDNGSQVFLYHLEVTQGTSSNPQVTLESATCGYVLQECQYDLQLVGRAGAIVTANCFGFRNLGVAAAGPVAVQLLAGGLQGQNAGEVVASQGGEIIVDQDFALTSAAPYAATVGGLVVLGDASYWTQGSGTQAIQCGGGLVVHQAFFDGEGIFYGTDGGTVIVTPFSAGGGVVVCASGGTVAQFACTHANFTLGTETSAFGFDESAGTYVGPTTCTFAHVDAVLGAGTGFGGKAVDPATGCMFLTG